MATQVLEGIFLYLLPVLGIQRDVVFGVTPLRRMLGISPLQRGMDDPKFILQFLSNLIGQPVAFGHAQRPVRPDDGAEYQVTAVELPHVQIQKFGGDLGPLLERQPELAPLIRLVLELLADDLRELPLHGLIRCSPESTADGAAGLVDATASLSLGVDPTLETTQSSLAMAD